MRNFSESTIQQYTNGSSFDRGYAYYQNGDVFLIEQRGNKLTARVAGSGYEPYLVQIELGSEDIETAMQAVGQNYQYYSGDFIRVLDATKEEYPNWGILKCKKLAETIMDEGRSREYQTAVNWVARAKEIYVLHNQHDEYASYLDGLLSKHGRKYKLVPLLKSIR